MTRSAICFAPKQRLAFDTGRMNYIAKVEILACLVIAQGNIGESLLR